MSDRTRQAVSANHHCRYKRPQSKPLWKKKKRLRLVKIVLSKWEDRTKRYNSMESPLKKAPSALRKAKRRTPWKERSLWIILKMKDWDKSQASSIHQPRPFITLPNKFSAQSRKNHSLLRNCIKVMGKSRRNNVRTLIYKIKIILLSLP